MICYTSARQGSLVLRWQKAKPHPTAIRGSILLSAHSMHDKVTQSTSPLSLAIGIALIGLASQTFAQASLEILVIDVVPAGSSIDSSKLPYPIQVGSAQELQNVGAVSLADFMGQSFSSVSLNDAQNNNELSPKNK